jgi:hypothetical protein
MAQIRLDQEVLDDLLRFKAEVEARSLGEAVRVALRRARREPETVDTLVEGACFVNGVSYTQREIRKLKAVLPQTNRSAWAMHEIGAERPGEEYNLWDVAARAGITERNKTSQFRVVRDLGRYSQLLQRVLAKPVVHQHGVDGVGWPIEWDPSSGIMTYVMPAQIAAWWLAS